MSTRAAYPILFLATCILADAPTRASTIEYLPLGYLPSRINGNSVIGKIASAGSSTTGFFYDGATYTTIAFPGATKTELFGVEGSTVVGQYTDAAKLTHGFVYDGTTYTKLDPVSKTTGGSANDIRDGRIVGTYADASSKTHGFIYDGSTFTVLDHPLAAGGGGFKGVSGNSIIGSYRDASKLGHGIFYDGTTFTTLDHPDAVLSTIPQDVSGNNIIGQYSTATGTPHSFYFDGSTWTTLAVPGASSTDVGGISGDTAAGTASFTSVVGYTYNPATGYSTPLNVVDFFNFPGFFPTGFRFDDISGNNVIGQVFYGSGPFYGFIATIPEPSTLMLAGLGLACVLVAAGFHWLRQYFVVRSSSNARSDQQH
jgi:hypothetical protein